MLAPALPAAACTLQWAADAGPLASRWHETGAQGETLVRERGSLQAAALALQGQDCAWRWAGPWSATLSAARGGRDYDGQTSSGQALQTRSDLQHTGLVLQALPWGDEHWRLGARLRWQRVARDIRSTAAAAGYPERFDTAQAALVGRLSGSLDGSLDRSSATAPAPPLQAAQWELQLALGGGPGGRLRLQLPGLDPATLRLGSSRLLQFEARLHGPLAPAWRWQLALQAGSERAAAGPLQALTRNGQIVGAAQQPATRQSVLGIAIGLAWQPGTQR
ncbi:MAG: hypothetical protein LCI02_02370 [Proteobacteria bacterium]|nr:hypothetical protein [Pseudomonadota bacterium]